MLELESIRISKPLDDTTDCCTIEDNMVLEVLKQNKCTDCTDRQEEPVMKMERPGTGVDTQRGKNFDVFKSDIRQKGFAGFRLVNRIIHKKKE